MTENAFILERIEFSRKDVTFKAKVFRPLDLKNAKGIVIFSHGLGYCDRQYKINGELFANNGYLTCIYNLRGHAATPGVWTLDDSVDDLVECISCLIKSYQFENNSRVCVLGHSTGALILLLASLKDRRIKFGSVVTVLTCLTDSYLHWFKSGFNVGVREYLKVKGVIPPLVEKFITDPQMLEIYKRGEIPQEAFLFNYRYGLLSGENWDDFFSQIAYSPDIVKNAKKLTLPLLLFRGEDDEIINVKKTNELYENLDKKIPSRLYITKSKNHFHNDNWELIQSETMKFFDKFCRYSEDKNMREVKDILIIDDEELVLKTLNLTLKKNGFKNIQLASSGEEALRKMEELRRSRNKEYDLIVTDIRMPGLDGIETIRRMKAIVADMDNQSPVIFMTGYEGERTQKEAQDLGYVDYLFKPFDAEVFLISVRKQLE